MLSSVPLIHDNMGKARSIHEMAVSATTTSAAAITIRKMDVDISNVAPNVADADDDDDIVVGLGKECERKEPSVNNSSKADDGLRQHMQRQLQQQQHDYQQQQQQQQQQYSYRNEVLRAMDCGELDSTNGLINTCFEGLAAESRHVDTLVMGDVTMYTDPTTNTNESNSAIHNHHDGIESSNWFDTGNQLDDDDDDDRGGGGDEDIDADSSFVRDSFVSNSGLNRIQNLLQMPRQQARYENIISRTCYYAWHVLTRRVDSNYPDVKKKVLNSDLVQNAVHHSAQDEYKKLTERKDSDLQTLVEKHRQSAFDQLLRLQSCISSSLLRIAGWVLYRLLSRIFTSIQFNKSQMDRIRSCSNKKPNIPMVYLPLHRSHLDYILISFILYMNNIKPPLVAAGDNLMIPFFGNLMRGLGAFFIKRRTEKTRENQVYQAVLRSYINENLQAGNSLEFFIEGGRTRTGKVVMPKFGLLSMVVDALLQGCVDDVYIVPVSISYEKLVDGSFIDEQMGIPKKFENFSATSKAIWSTLHSNFGIVRVDFSKPFLLKEFLYQSIQRETECFDIPKELTLQARKDFNAIRDCIACEGSIVVNKIDRDQVDSMFSHRLHVKETRRQCIESLARHVLYDAYKESALMSTHMVAFLLLTKYRKGVTLDQLANDLDWLRDILCREKGQALSAFGECDDLVRQAVFYLGKELVATEKVSMKWSSWRSSVTTPNARNSCKPYNRFKSNNPKVGQQRKNNTALWQQSPDIDSNDIELNNDQNSQIEIVYLRPVLKFHGALQLHYYSNSCVSLFALESVLANSLFSFINGDICSLIYDPSTYISNLTINKAEFIEKCKQVCSIMQYEFYFTKTCQTLDHALDFAFDSFVAKNFFVQSRNNRSQYSQRMSLITEKAYQLNRSSSSSSSSSSGTGSLEVIEESLSEEEYEYKEIACEPIRSKIRYESNDRSEFRLLLTSRNCQMLNFYRSILAPYIESYWLVTDRLATWMANESIKSPVIVPETTFLQHLTTTAQQMLHKGEVYYEESISYDTFRNSLKYLDFINAIRRFEQDRRGKLLTATSKMTIEAVDNVQEHSFGDILSTNPNGSLTTTTTTTANATTATMATTSVRKKGQIEVHIYPLLNAAQMRSMANSLRIFTTKCTAPEYR